MSEQSPIADLSYRNYNGPKSLTTARWWVVARNGLRVAFRKKGLWVLLGVSSLQYLFLLFMLFIRTFGGEMIEEQLGSFRQLLVGVYSGSFWPLMIALLVGAGSIAADNRANALQVYLAKPMTKRDYLIGKWLSIFLIIFGAYFVPMLIVISYQALDVGVIEFFKTDGIMFAALPLMAGVPAALHASLLLGISAWNKTPWIVGVIYAGLYFFTTLLANVVAGSIDASERVESTLRHLSIEGLVSGFGQWILNATPRSLVPTMDRPVMPYAMPLILAIAALIVLGILVARARIRPVEVVQG